MSGTWASFKRAFGATTRRDLKAQAALSELDVQARVRTSLGDTVSGGALGTKHGTLQGDLTKAQLLGDTNTGYTDLGKVKTDARKAIPEAIRKKQIEGLGKTIPAFISNVQTAVDELANDRDKAIKKTAPGHQKQLDKLKNDFAATDTNTPKQELERIQSGLEKVLASAFKAGYPGNADAANSRRQKAYKEALEARYGFKMVSAESSERLMKALAILPDEHISHTSLTDIEVKDHASGAVGDYDKTHKTIHIDTAKIKAKPKFEYTVDGKQTKVDTFTVATLHEVGHSVDDKANIMADTCGAAYGNWNTKTLDQVADDFWTELERTLGATHKDAILQQMKEALDNKTYEKPDAVSTDHWKTADATLKMLKELAGDATPWKKVRNIGDVVYHKSGGKWRTYSLAARNNQFVRDYQWNAPAEWFAELYAISWLTKKKPPNGIAAAAAEYMYREKS